MTNDAVITNFGMAKALNLRWPTISAQVILFGGACSKVTDQIVKAARHWNLVQVKILLTFAPNPSEL